MAIPTDHTMIWAEVYSGVPGLVRTKCLDYGWLAFPKDTSEDTAHARAREFLRKEHPVTEETYPVILTYPMNRTCGFKASDRILGVFG